MSRVASSRQGSTHASRVRHESHFAIAFGQRERLFANRFADRLVAPNSLQDFRLRQRFGKPHVQQVHRLLLNPQCRSQRTGIPQARRASEWSFDRHTTMTTRWRVVLVGQAGWLDQETGHNSNSFRRGRQLSLANQRPFRSDAASVGVLGGCSAARTSDRR